ncbi:hypothetical protein AKO1_013629 [Acrasis kona]|uniref:Uncharacterized protein n=1 Tax=Acrasis kona TaxID=1008807 RepID=A0AAW2YU55_9EUKA
MFIECNLPILVDGYDTNEILNRSCFLKNLGWDGVVLNVSISKNNISELDLCFDKLSAMTNRLEREWSEFYLQYNKSAQNDNIRFVSPLTVHNERTKEFRFYKRLTFVEDFESFSRLNFDLQKFRSVDIIAVVPTTMNQLENVTSKMNIDMISFQYDSAVGGLQRTLIHSGAKRLQELMKRDVAIEISYSESFKERKNFTDFISRMTDLMRLTKNRNMVLSNGSSDQSHFRSPHDVANLPALLGVDFSVGKKMIDDNVRMSLLHGEQRRTVKGVLQVSDSTPSGNKRSRDKMDEK